MSNICLWCQPLKKFNVCDLFQARSVMDSQLFGGSNDSHSRQYAFSFFVDRITQEKADARSRIAYNVKTPNTNNNQFSYWIVFACYDINLNFKYNYISSLGEKIWVSWNITNEINLRFFIIIIQVDILAGELTHPHGINTMMATTCTSQIIL